MSWLFDRLCELAAADRVDIVIDADTSGAAPIGDGSDVSDVLVRASELPDLAVWLMSDATEVAGPPAVSECVDLRPLGDAEATAAIARLRTVHHRSPGTVLHVEAGRASLEAAAGPDGGRVAAMVSQGTTNMLASGRVGHSDTFRALQHEGLGVAIGAIDPEASVSVPDVAGVVAIVDALVALRSFAFSSPASEVCAVPAVRSML